MKVKELCARFVLSANATCEVAYHSVHIVRPGTCLTLTRISDEERVQRCLFDLITYSVPNALE